MRRYVSVPVAPGVRVSPEAAVVAARAWARCSGC